MSECLYCGALGPSEYDFVPVTVADLRRVQLEHAESCRWLEGQLQKLTGCAVSKNGKGGM